MTLEELTVEHEKLKAQHANAMESLQTRQVRLDEQLQLHVDKDAAHAKALADKDAELAKVKDALATTQKLLQDAEVDHSKTFAQFQDAIIQHNAEIARLKTEVLIPAQRDLHARQLADLQRQHQAELEKLK